MKSKTQSNEKGANKEKKNCCNFVKVIKLLIEIVKLEKFEDKIFHSRVDKLIGWVSKARSFIQLLHTTSEARPISHF